MLGSIDCTHWSWKNCPKAWAGQYKGTVSGVLQISALNCPTGKDGHPTIVLEAISDAVGRIWHCFFGMPGANNDINVLENSTLFRDAMNGRAPEVKFQVNGTDYSMCYWLADGIYPEYSCFVKTISHPFGKKAKFFAKMQEGRRKDVERCFGILQSRWHVITNPCKLWDPYAMKSVIKTCVILHNMIIENELDDHDMERQEYAMPEDAFQIVPRDPQNPDPLVARRFLRDLGDKVAHRQLKTDLMEHLWSQYGDAEE